VTLYRSLHNSKTHAQGNDPNCPVCQRHVQVADAISDVNARRVCDLEGPNGSEMTFYMLPNGQPFILQNYAKDAGFEIFGTISHSNRTQDTLDSLKQLAAVRVGGGPGDPIRTGTRVS